MRKNYRRGSAEKKAVNFTWDKEIYEMMEEVRLKMDFPNRSHYYEGLALKGLMLMLDEQKDSSGND